MAVRPVTGEEPTEGTGDAPAQGKIEGSLRGLARTAGRQATKKTAVFLASNPVVLAVVALALVLLLVVMVAAGGALVQAGQLAPSDPAAIAVKDIPPDDLELYRASADDFHVPWAILAGIGKVASDHGRRSPYDSIRRGDGQDSSLFPEVKPPIGDSASPALGPMLIRPAGYRDIRHFNPQRVRHSVDWVAERLAPAADAEADKLSIDRDQLELDLAQGDEGAEEAWTRLWTAVVNRLDLGSTAGCSLPGSSVGDRIVSIWRCSLDAGSLHVLTVKGEVSGAGAVDVLTKEALGVAWLFSRWGAVPCDPTADAAGVFPLPRTSTVDRCNAEANIAEAARLVAAGESVPVSQRSGTPGDRAEGGWKSLPTALGPDGGQEFARSGFPQPFQAGDRCRSLVDAQVRALPANGDASRPTPFAGFSPAKQRAQYDTSWAAEPLSGVRTDPACSPAADPASWQRFVLVEMRQVFRADSAALDPDGNSVGIMSYLEVATAPPPAGLGRTSLIERLSNPEVTVRVPSPSGRSADFADPSGLGANAVRWAKAYMGLGPPPLDDGCSTFSPAGIAPGDPSIASDAKAVPAGAATGEFTDFEWAKDFITRLGVPDTSENERAVVAWERAEGGHFVNDARFNPLNTTMRAPGSGGMNSVGVQSYPDYETGMAATLATIRLPFYEQVIAALRAGDSAENVVRAIGESPWGTFKEGQGRSILASVGTEAGPAGSASGSTTGSTGCQGSDSGSGGLSADTGPYSGGDCPGRGPNGETSRPPEEQTTVQGIVVHKCLAGKLDSMLTAARADGVELGGSGYRSRDDQVRLRRQNCGSSDYAIYEAPSTDCSPNTARPGYSNHEGGMAIDFSNCSTGSSCNSWLTANAGRYGFKNYPPEPWHWSIDGR